jgi:hypothetical protein
LPCQAAVRTPITAPRAMTRRTRRYCTGRAGAAEEEERVSKALAPGGDDAEMLASSSVCNIDISRKDMRCLAGLNWLNDEVINFYMSLLQERELRLNPGACACARVHAASIY